VLDYLLSGDSGIKPRASAKEAAQNLLLVSAHGSSSY
jgi:hypothetical protein